MRHVTINLTPRTCNAPRAVSGALAAGSPAESASAGAASNAADPLAPKLSHHAGKAKCVIFLYMSGGVSHVDSFDPKPKLVADHSKQLTAAHCARSRTCRPT